MADISNSNSNSLVSGTSGNDYIQNYGSNSTLDGGAGNDYIENYGSNATIDAGLGNDSIENSSENSLIDGGAGNDSIKYYGSNSSINGGAGNDSIYNSGTNSTILGGKGNDTINLDYGSARVIYNSGDGYDRIIGFGTGDNTLQIAGGSGTYSMTKSGDNLIVNVGKGRISLVGAASLDSLTINDVLLFRSGKFNTNDTLINGSPLGDSLENSGSDVSIFGGAGADKITLSGAGSMIDAGLGNDSIYNNWFETINADGLPEIVSCGENSTILGGKGNDYISLGAFNNLVEYKLGDGKDTIVGFNESDTLSISGGTWSTLTKGNDILVKVVSGSILLKNAKDKNLNINKTDSANLITFSGGKNDIRNNLENVTIDALGGNDSIKNFAANVSVFGNGGNDSIFNYASTVTIDGGAGNDSIKNYESQVTIDGAAGNDSIFNESTSVSIDGGEGHDYIYNIAAKVTTSGGAGDDLISLSSVVKNNLIQYNVDEGNDFIYGLNASSSLKIGDGTDTYSSVKSGRDIVVTVGKGEITLVDATTLSKVNIVGKKSAPPSTLSTASPLTMDETLKAVDASNRTKAIYVIGNAQANSIVGGIGNDTLDGGKGNDTLTGGDGKNLFIYSGGRDIITDYDEEDKIRVRRKSRLKMIMSSSRSARAEFLLLAARVKLFLTSTQAASMFIRRLSI